MQSHDDSSHLDKNAFEGIPAIDFEEQQKQFLRRLQDRAADMLQHKASEITAGRDNEGTLAEWQFRGISVRQLPDDEQGILRISLGGGTRTPVSVNYCVFRGNRQECIDLLRNALVALQQKPTD